MGNTKTLYFDCQASTPVADEVFLKMQPYFRESFGNAHSTEHVFGWRSSAAVEEAAQHIAHLVGADMDEIIFTSGATESNNLAILGLAKNAVLNGSARKRILLSAIEHKCVLSVGRVLEEQYGFTVELIPVDRNGCVARAELERKIGDDVLMVSIMAVNNEIGTIQNIPALSSIVRSAGALFHSDAAQAPIAMNTQNIAEAVDLLSLSAHKMYGPQGIGALYISRELHDYIEPIIYGGGQQNGLRSGTLPLAICVGMGAAANSMNSLDINNVREQLRKRRARFIEHLLKLPHEIIVNGPMDIDRHPGNANVCFRGFSAQDILQLLQPYLAASTGSACSSGITEPSHVLRAIGLSGEDASSSIRFSLGFDTTDEDVLNAVDLVSKVLDKLKFLNCN